MYIERLRKKRRKRAKRKKSYALIYKIKCAGCSNCTTVYPSGRRWQEKQCSIGDKFIKYRANRNEIIKKNAYVYQTFGRWVWCNVYNKKTKQKIASYSCRDTPTAILTKIPYPSNSK